MSGRVDVADVGEAMPRGDGRSAPAPAPIASECRPEGGALGTYKGLSPGSRFEDRRTGCPRWPEGLFLRWQRGEISGIVPGRCKGVNVCDYCAIQSAHENARMLALDVLDGRAPELLLILGTRTATADPRPFYKGRERVIEALRDRFGRQVEYASLCEFTTGKGLHAGGERRPHWNVFVKGVDVEHLDEARAIVRDVWCRYVDAEPEAQYVEQLRDVGAAAKYVAMHFHKRDQAPPAGWRGQRFNCSRRYFGDRTRAEMRELAHESLRLDRELWRARESGLEGEAVEEAAAAAIAEASATSWELYRAPVRREPVRAADRNRMAAVPWFVLEAAFRWSDAAAEVTLPGCALSLDRRSGVPGPPGAGAECPA